jgi:hypothetical protein
MTDHQDVRTTLHDINVHMFALIDRQPDASGDLAEIAQAVRQLAVLLEDVFDQPSV